MEREMWWIVGYIDCKWVISEVSWVTPRFLTWVTWLDRDDVFKTGNTGEGGSIVGNGRERY